MVDSYRRTQWSASWKRSGWALDQWQKKQLMKRQETCCVSNPWDNKGQQLDLESPEHVAPHREGKRDCAGEGGGRDGPNHKLTSELHAGLRSRKDWSSAVNRKGEEIILKLCRRKSCFQWKLLLSFLRGGVSLQFWIMQIIRYSEKQHFLAIHKRMPLKNMLLPVGESMN